jgi:hypothetical protein
MPQLTNQESRGFTHYFRMNAAELVAAGTSAKTIAQIPRGGIVTNAAVTVISPITGVADITVTLGVTGTAAGFVASTDLDALVATAYNTGTLLDTEPGHINNTTSAVNIIATLGGTVASITGGEIVYALTILDPFNVGSNV